MSDDNSSKAIADDAKSFADPLTTAAATTIKSATRDPKNKSWVKFEEDDDNKAVFNNVPLDETKVCWKSETAQNVTHRALN